jgi:hypothetical protein
MAQEGVACSQWYLDRSIDRFGRLWVQIFNNLRRISGGQTDFSGEQGNQKLPHPDLAGIFFFFFPIKSLYFISLFVFSMPYDG